MKNNVFYFIFLGFILFSFLSCNNNTSRFKINTSKNRVNASIQRLDKDLILLNTDFTENEIKVIYSKYPEIFPVYVYNILDLDPADTLQVANELKNFLSDSTFKKVNQDVLAKFENVKGTEHKISEAYAYANHYFPEINLPEVYFFISGFNQSIMMTQKSIGIGIDMYLGADYPVYPELTYQYMIDNMKPENIAPDVITALLSGNFPMNTDNERLIDHMLHQGKILYLVSVFMPDEKEENIIGYTKAQINWSKNFEPEIWAAIIEQKHLFSTDNLLIRKYLYDAPFTSPVSQDSPGRLGTWVGMQIIKSYMKNNKDVTLSGLMAENDYQLILEKSGYHP